MFFSRRGKAARPTCLRQILVVEDDALVAFDHEHDLSGAGYDVVATVNNGEAAVAILAEHSIDVVVLDLNLSGEMTGAAIARLAHDRGIAVLLVSGDGPGDAAPYAFGALAKPLANGALVRALKAMEKMLCRGEAIEAVKGLTLLQQATSRL